MGVFIPTPGRFDPYNFPDTGPVGDALRLMKQGAPGAPVTRGTCQVQMVAEVTTDFEITGFHASAEDCGKVGPSRAPSALGQALADGDADRMDGHQCGNATW